MKFRNNNMQSFLDRNRLSLAFFLSGIVLVVYSWMFVPQVVQQENDSQVQENRKSSTNILANPVAVEKEPAVLSFGSIVWLEGDVLRVGVDTQYGAIKEVFLKEGDGKGMVQLSCHQETPLQAPGVLHFDPLDAKGGGKDAGSLIKFQRVFITKKEGPPSALSLETGLVIGGESVRFVREYRVEGYKVCTTLKVKGMPRFEEGRFLKIFNGTCIREGNFPKNSSEKTSFDIKTVSYTKNNQNQAALSWRVAHLWSKVEDQEQVAQCDWIAIDDRFYVRTLQIASSAHSQQKAFFYKNGTETYGGYEIPLQKSAVNSEEIFQGNFSFLPKNRGLLNQIYAERRETFYLIYRQFSLMKILSDMLYNVIVFTYNFTKSYGLSLILVTILLKVLVFPFAKRSHFSMKKMQMIEPRIREIRQKYQENSQTASLKLMQLYKQEKINPASGCLGAVLPAPFFIALYSLFQNMVELEGQSFLWIKDLALPDVVIASYSIPFVGGGIRVLPFLVAVSHVLQMKFIPKPTVSNGGDMIQTQMQLVNYFLPVLFFFICWGLPSGLVLFWLLQNVLSILQNTYFLYLSRDLG